MFGINNTTDDDGTTPQQPTADDSVQTMPVPTPDEELSLPEPEAEAHASETPSFIETPLPNVPANDPTPEEAPAETSEPAEPAHEPINITSSGTLNSLSSLKQDALRELSPLIEKLDQTPEEKYETAKMIYEETNDNNMLSVVYEAAKNLSDEKIKAAAIYDVIKKINELA